MKTAIRLIVVVLLIAVALPLVPAGAQDSAPVVPALLFYQSASGGSFTDNGDQTYTLTLENVSKTVLLRTDPVSVTPINTKLFANGWVTATGDTQTDAVLVADTLKISLKLKASAYDETAGTVTYVAQIVSMTSSDPTVNPDKIEVPATFGAADLAIEMTLDLGMSISEGAIAGMRADPCGAEWTAMQNAQNSYNTTCTSGKTSSSCSSLNTAQSNAYDNWWMCEIMS